MIKNKKVKHTEKNIYIDKEDVIGQMKFGNEKQMKRNYKNKIY